MDIRHATLNDGVEVLEMLLSFAATSPYTNLIDVYQIGQMAGSFILDADKLALICPGKGVLLAMAMPFVWGRIKTATEMAWWVQPEHRKNGVGQALIEAFQNWAAEKECKAITLTSLDNSVDKLYGRLGYKLCEQTYIKEI